jgi:hypothetical protein
LPHAHAPTQIWNNGLLSDKVNQVTGYIPGEVDPSDFRKFELSVSIWWSDAAAAHYVDPRSIAADNAAYLASLSGKARRKYEKTIELSKRYERWSRVDNVVADYIDSRYTAKFVARLKRTLAALARAPTVKPPCSHDSCTVTAPPPAS